MLGALLLIVAPYVLAKLLGPSPKGRRKGRKGK